MRDWVKIVEAVIPEGKCGSSDIVCPLIGTTECPSVSREGPRPTVCPFGLSPVTVIAGSGIAVEHKSGGVIVSSRGGAR